ncbi:influenza virus NS1A-binding protein homolog A-like [Artemia franciscana]|nr:hypothetical protein QYM36_007849 [Artemia franciscana]KAK2727155.1 hypothetical protein QYM36_007849 [Artemia franciscana]KAK2727158.1 hypothetical protein QYM36_007849 [Artemia franciscana]
MAKLTRTLGLNNKHANESLSNIETNENDEELATASPSLSVDDDVYLQKTFEGLNLLRKSNQFCDVVLQVGTYEISAHRVVLACASPYLFDLFDADIRYHKNDEKVIKYKLNDGFDKESLETVIHYAYTGRLDVPLSRVKSVYLTASRLKMERIVNLCAHFLVDNLDPITALDIRSLPGITKHEKLVEKVDKYLAAEIGSFVTSNHLLTIPVIQIEVLANSKEEVNTRTGAPFALSTLILDWIRKEFDSEATINNLAGKTHMLYLNLDNSLHDCTDIEKGDSQDSDIIQNYQLESKRHGKPVTKNRKLCGFYSSRPRAMLYSRSISDQMPAADSSATTEWRLIAAQSISETSILGLVVINGCLASLSVVQRMNNNSVAAGSGETTNIPGGTATPGRSRSPSQEEEFAYKIIPPMSNARCTMGCASFNNTLIVCGGYNRGECLRTVEAYNPATNMWVSLPSMREPRGRLDIGVAQGKIYAIGGCSGTKELSSVETYQPHGTKWEMAPPLKFPRSNIGVADLDGNLYCIGGWDGQSAIKTCDMYNPVTNQWSSIAPLNIGRYQAGVTSCRGRIFAVGGTDNWNCLNSVEYYDPKKNVWELFTPLSIARRGSGVAFYNEKLWAIGGSDGVETLFSTEFFDFTTNTWNKGPNLTSRRANTGVANVNNKLFAVGGFSGRAFLDTIECLDEQAEEWTSFVYGQDGKNRQRSMSPLDVSRRPSASTAMISHDEFTKLRNDSCKLDNLQELPAIPL